MKLLSFPAEFPVRSVFGNVPRGCHGLGGAGETGSRPLETAADPPHFAHGDVGAVSPPPRILAEPLTLTKSRTWQKGHGAGPRPPP